jgi:hypothetical protein
MPSGNCLCVLNWHTDSSSYFKFIYMKSTSGQNSKVQCYLAYYNYFLH